MQSNNVLKLDHSYFPLTKIPLLNFRRGAAGGVYLTIGIDSNIFLSSSNYLLYQNTSIYPLAYHP